MYKVYQESVRQTEVINSLKKVTKKFNSLNSHDFAFHIKPKSEYLIYAIKFDILKYLRNKNYSLFKMSLLRQ